MAEAQAYMLQPGHMAWSDHMACFEEVALMAALMALMLMI